MASMRPISRLLTRTTTTTLRTQHSQPTHLRPLLSTSSFHTSRLLFREDQNFGHTGRRVPSSTSPDASPSQPKPNETLSSGIAPSTLYTFTDIQSIASAPSSHPHTLLIDVREPGELLTTGRIPNALNIPIKSAPDAFFLSPEDFEDRYGFERPGDGDHVIFYCKAGVRSKAAARLAGQAGFGGSAGEYPGSMDEWIEKGGELKRE